MASSLRWDALFADLEAQLAEAERRSFEAEVADRTRRERALIGLRDRLRQAAAQRYRVAVTVAGRRTVEGTVLDAGPDWLLLDDRDGGEVLVPLAAVVWLRGLGARVGADPAPEVARRLTLSFALRGIAQDRAPVTVTLADGSLVTGTIDRVGADFVDLAEHAAGEPRRASAVSGVRTLPLGALVLVRLR